MSLHLIPYDKIPRVFNQLKLKALVINNPLLDKFVSYVERNWIASTKWPPVVWSQFMQYLRTNNDVEGWHSRLIRLKGAKAGMNFYALLPLLLTELKLIQLHIALLCQNQTLRERRNVAKCTHNNLMDAWESYNDGTIKSLHLLKECARVYTDINNLRYGKCPDDTRRDEPDTDDENPVDEFAEVDDDDE